MTKDAYYAGPAKEKPAMETTEPRDGTSIPKTEPCTGHPRKGCTDHLGNSFPSVKAMCKAWDVSPGTYHVRIKKGMSLEEALAAKVKVRENEPKEVKNDGEKHAC